MDIIKFDLGINCSVKICVMCKFFNNGKCEKDGQKHSSIDEACSLFIFDT